MPYTFNTIMFYLGKQEYEKKKKIVILDTAIISDNVIIHRKKNAKLCTWWSLQRPRLPLTVRQANEVWFPTWKDTVPESFSVTLLRVSVCLLPSTWITFISLL